MKSLLLFFSLIALPSTSRAGLLFEPYGGYSWGSESVQYSDTYSVTALQGTTAGASVNGSVYGGRAGFLLHGFVILAAEYQAISGKENFTTPATNTNINTWTQKTWFGTFGFQCPNGFRLLASYGWDFEATETSSGAQPLTYKGTAQKFGVGWVLPLNLAINVEYAIYKPTQYTQNAITSPLTNSYSAYNYSAVIGTLSIPIDLFGGDNSRGSTNRHSSGGGGHRN